MTAQVLRSCWAGSVTVRRGRGWSHSIEGTRSFGVGLAGVVAAGGLRVIGCEQPNRKARRGKAQVRPDRRPSCGAGRAAAGFRPATPYLASMVTVRRWAILLGTRHELSVATTAQTNRLRALLLGGQDTERDLARATLTDPVLAAIAAAGTTTGQPRTGGAAR